MPSQPQMHSNKGEKQNTIKKIGQIRALNSLRPSQKTSVFWEEEHLTI